ncbi:MAG: nucleoside monophosphate kinase [Planctomycetes bacterium]|nr:nucleoside monophosphate kinase [Planctomycetota bacterium]
MPHQKRYQAVLMFGGPGTGKGTQGVVLGQFSNLVHMAMGDIFRALDKQSAIGQEFLSYATQGLLVPDELTVQVWQGFVDHQIATGKLDPNYHTLILDGIPRTLRQVELLSERLDLLKVVHLAMSDRSALIARLKGRALEADRPDDADEQVIRKRLEVYDEETRPVLESFDRSLIAEINADQPPLAVLRDIAAVLVDCVPAAI